MCLHVVRQPGLFLLKYLLLPIGMAILLAPSTADAANVTVGCTGEPAPGPEPHYTTIMAALADLDPRVPNTVTVEGTCHNDNPRVQVVGFWDLTIQAGPAGATISRNPIQCSPDAVGPPTLEIVDSHPLRLIGVVISGGTGVQISDGRVLGIGLTVENSFGDGIRVNNASTLNLRGSSFGPSPVPMPNVVQNNCGAGISVSYGSSASLNFGNTVQGNGGQGLNVQGSASLSASADASGQILIQNNQRQGVSAGATGNVGFSGQVIVQNNSTLSDPSLFPFPAGVIVGGGSIGVNGPGLQILNNNGPGIWAFSQGTVRFGGIQSEAGNISISGNTAEGLRLTQMSMGWLFQGTSISGNTGADATCDNTSYLFGDVTGISVNTCNNTEQEKKK